MATRVVQHSLRILAALAILCGAASAVAAAATTPAASHDGTTAGGELLVFGAVSLTDVLGEVDQAFTAQTGVAVKASFAASSVLAKQIESGAPADVFLSADVEWMDYLSQRGLIEPRSRRDLLGNALVLVAPADSRVTLRIAPGFDLAGALAGGRLAVADPDSVPAGRYARAALEHFGVWDSVAQRLARAENVRAALAYVAHGETPLGIVYRTDALAERQVRVVDSFPADSYPPITYPLALTRHARPASARYAEFLTSAAARRIFVRFRFVPLDAASGR